MENVMAKYYAVIHNADSSIQTETLPVKESPLWWQEQNLSYTASGYGSRIPTRYMVKVGSRWRRVYCCIYSNSGTLFIGRDIKTGTIVEINRAIDNA